jgi:outer membrane protein assembly factor BamE (lipoprotein component of BamABCDE complex)
MNIGTLGIDMKFFFALIMIFVVTACTPATQKRGNFLFDEDIAAIQPGVTTEFDVRRLLGSPTATAVFDDKTWYYVGLQTEKESFFDERIIDKRVHKIQFDEAGTVITFTEVTEDSVDVPLANRVTPTSGNEVTILQQILGNVGKFNR